MKFFKTLFALAAFAILISPFATAQAVSLSDLQQQIKDLTTQVTSLSQMFGAQIYRLSPTSAVTQTSVSLSPESVVASTPITITPQGIVIKNDNTLNPNSILTTTVLRPGLKEDVSVQLMQQALKDKGFYYGPIDGSYGPNTINAVRGFQAQNNLKTDGIAGSSTLIALSGSTTPYLNASSATSPTFNSGLVTSTTNVSPIPLTASRTKCSTPVKVILIPEETSPDGISASQIGVNQEIARFWLYSPCNITIGSINTQAFGTYSIDNGQGQSINYTALGANRFSQFSLHKGFDANSPVLGTANYNGLGNAVNLNAGLQLTAGIPQAISISGKLKSLNQVSGPIIDRGQFCIETPMNVTDSSGNLITLQQPLSSLGNSGNFFGRFTCGDIFGIN